MGQLVCRYSLGMMLCDAQCECKTYGLEMMARGGALHVGFKLTHNP
jgi:hypothetical protein